MRFVLQDPGLPVKTLAVASLEEAERILNDVPCNRTWTLATLLTDDGRAYVWDREVGGRYWRRTAVRG